MRQKGQSFVEFALALPVLLIFLLGVLDISLFGINQALAKSYSHIAAREASVYMQDDVETCLTRVNEALPEISFFGQTSYSLTVYPCSYELNWEVPEGTQVLARLSFQYRPIIWPADFLNGVAETTAVFERTGFSQ